MKKELLMLTAAARLLALVLLIAATPAGALDPTPPGTLHPEPLPPLANPDAPSTPAKELFARKSTPFAGRSPRRAQATAAVTSSPSGSRNQRCSRRRRNRNRR